MINKQTLMGGYEIHKYIILNSINKLIYIDIKF
jgi:hypothetical protein